MAGRSRPLRRLWTASVGVLVAVALAGCAHKNARTPSAGEQEADKYLFDHGTESLQKHSWLQAREYFRRLVDTYPQSQYRQDAKLGIGDSFLGEKRVDSDILAANEFREFLTFFPLNPRADYAQYKLALSQFNQMLAPGRDQTATHDALRELDTFVQAYPDSPLMPEVLKLQRQARDRLSQHEYQIGLQYFRTRWYPGAISRFQEVLAEDPQFSRRDALYYYLAEAYNRSGRPTEALPYYGRLIEEFKVSDYLKRANERISAIKR
jgi:outer membrane protein assembly factor BamD